MPKSELHSYKEDWVEIAKYWMERSEYFRKNPDELEGQKDEKS